MRVFVTGATGFVMGALARALRALGDAPQTLAQSGYQYRAVLTNSAGTTMTNPATLSVLGVSTSAPAPALPNTGLAILGPKGLTIWPALLALLALLGAGFTVVRRRTTR